VSATEQLTQAIDLARTSFRKLENQIQQSIDDQLNELGDTRLIEMQTKLEEQEKALRNWFAWFNSADPAFGPRFESAVTSTYIALGEKAEDVRDAGC
tara:strand:+ start:8890 stop:9180 length:291 start_codon:yes stop_codon:yes gene_type:complete